MGIRAGMVAFGAGVVAVVSVPVVLSVTADAATDVLLSRARPVIASTTRFLAGDAGRAVDGNPGTSWVSMAGPGSEWLRLDLGRPQKVTRVRVTWGAEWAKAYRVQISADAASWSDLYRTWSGDGGTDDLKDLAGTGRYLRLLGTVRGTGAGYSVAEMQFFGPGPAGPATPGFAPTAITPSAAVNLDDPRRKEIALQLVSTAENSTTNWRGQYGYIEDIGDGRGYTGGIVGFTSGTSDMLALVTEYDRRRPGTVLAKFLPALRLVDGSDSHAGLDPGFTNAWRAAATDPVFQKTQEDERDRMYFTPAVTLAKGDGLRALGQFAYYDAAVMHGMSGLRAIRAYATRTAATPAGGGDETIWLSSFLESRVRSMRTEEAHSDTTRVDTAQRVFLKATNLDLNVPLSWKVYGDSFRIPN